MFTDPQFWVAVAFIIFVIAIFNPVRKMISSSLDEKINEIKNSINEAEELKKETLASLNQIKNRKNEVELEIKDIHSESSKKIKLLEKQAQQNLSEQTNKRELLASAKIEQLIKDTNIIIQQHISQTAIEITTILLQRKLNHEEKQKLMDQSINDLKKAINN